VIKNAPFDITRFQLDNGTEFTFKYLSHTNEPKEHVLDRFCLDKKIRHVLIPPGKKEL